MESSYLFFSSTFNVNFHSSFVKQPLFNRFLIISFNIGIYYIIFLLLKIKS